MCLVAGSAVCACVRAWDLYQIGENENENENENKIIIEG